MANQGGKNGAVTVAASGPSGRSAHVDYPEDPGPPPVAAHSEDYTAPIPDDVWAIFVAASMTQGAKVDVTVDGSGKANGAASHR